MIDTNEQISNIMKELGLDSNDANARKVIERLLSAKPDVAINAQFLTQLRNELQAHGNTAGVPATSNNKLTNFPTMFINKILASALVVMIVVAAGGFWYIQNRTDQPLFTSPATKQANQVLSGKYGVSEAAQESFGDLSKVSIVNTKNTAGLNASNKAVSAPQATTATAPEMRAFAADNDAKLIAPGEPYPVYNYSYKYVGKDLPTLGANQAVMKRVLPKQQPTLIDRVISALSFGLVDLTKFHDVKIQSLSFVEDHEYGYNVNVDMVNGSVGIYQNWDKWPQPDYSTCAVTSTTCGPQPLKIGDIPADDELFKATDAFLDSYGISRESYGQPTVDNTWRIAYQNAPQAEKDSFYIPEQMYITYPLMLDYQQVYDENGNPYGLSVGYDIRNRKVLSVYELTTHQYERSQYTGVTDTKKIIDYAEHGGFRNYLYPVDRSLPENANAKNAVLRLDTPTVKLVKMYYADPNQPYNPSNNGELYVPALVFPIKNSTEVNFYRSNVIVPLVKAVFDSDYMNGQNPPIAQPLGTMSGSSAGGVAGVQTVNPADLPKQQ